MAPPSSTLPPILTDAAVVYHNYIHPFLPSPLQSVVDNLTPILTSVLTSATNGNLTSLISTLVIVYLSLRIADYLRRSLLAWIAFVVKIVLVILLVNTAIYVNRVGVTKALEDGEWIFGLIWAFVEEKVNMTTGGNENGTGYFNGAGNQWNFNGGVGRKQQVPVGKGTTKKRGGGWT